MKKYLRIIFAFQLIFGLASFAAAQSNKCTPKSSAACIKKTTACSVTKNNANCVMVACGPEGTKVSEAKIITALREKLVALRNDMHNHPSLNLDAQFAEHSISIGKDDDESLAILQVEIEKIEKEMNRQIPQARFISNEAEIKYENKAQLVASLNQRVERLKSNL